MKNILSLLLGVSILLTASYGEVFIKDYQKIKYTLKAEKPVNFEFKFTSPKERCTVSFNIVNESDKLLLKDHHDMRKANDTFNLSVKEGIYNIELSTHSGCLNKPFELGLTKISGNFEQEINDNVSIATPLTASTNYFGYLQKRTSGTKGKDIDFFKITLEDKSKIKLIFKHKKIDSREYFYVELFNSNNKKLLNKTSELNKKGISENIILNKGEYFVKISTYSASTQVRGKEYILQYQMTKK